MSDRSVEVLKNVLGGKLIHTSGVIIPITYLFVERNILLLALSVGVALSTVIERTRLRGRMRQEGVSLHMYILLLLHCQQYFSLRR
jgi:hypothetical protein